MNNKTTIPFIYDVTLRDGNQALQKPWNVEEKLEVFKEIVNLGIDGAEVGFPAASDMDFEACQKIASIAPDNFVVGVLARATSSDINAAIKAIRYAKKSRIHTFIAMNPNGLKHVLKKDISEVEKIAINAVKQIKNKAPHAQIEFSVEHFGDCKENLTDVISTLEKIVDAGATVINLPNTVERFRPMEYLKMVEAVYNKIGDKATVSVHCHNDLGMATATTVESFFIGATQLETTLNGLGERAGNTNMFEVAAALYNSGVKTNLNMSKFMEVANKIAKMSQTPIAPKAPLIGQEAFMNRSGIHQDGVVKTQDLEKNQYSAINPRLLGRTEGEQMGFTSQSGANALITLCKQNDLELTIQEAKYLTPIAKKIAEKKGELRPEDIKEIYINSIQNIKEDFYLSSFQHIKKANIR